MKAQNYRLRPEFRYIAAPGEKQRELVEACLIAENGPRVGLSVASVTVRHDNDNEGLARMFAASPDLLAVACAIRDLGAAADEGWPNGLWDQLEAAIAKAEGRAA